jgi:hypothetical protein
MDKLFSDNIFEIIKYLDFDNYLTFRQLSKKYNQIIIDIDFFNLSVKLNHLQMFLNMNPDINEGKVITMNLVNKKLGELIRELIKMSVNKKIIYSLTFGEYPFGYLESRSVLIRFIKYLKICDKSNNFVDNFNICLAKSLRYTFYLDCPTSTYSILNN